MTTRTKPPFRLAGLPVVVENGRFRLPQRRAICHGYANCCDCADCTERDDAAQRDAERATPAQPWEPRPPRHLREAA